MSSAKFVIINNFSYLSIMDKLNRDINLFLCINHHRNHLQVGGTGRQEIVYNGHKIYYTSYQNEFGDNDTIFINGGRDSGRRPCFILSIKGTVGTLQSLERGTDCFIDRHDNSKDLVKVAFQIAKEKGCTEFQLTDNSFLSCTTDRFSLSDVYFLTKGQTWYESLIPIKILSWDETKLETYRKRAIKNKWSIISKYLISEGVNLDFISTEGIDINKAGSAMAILNRVKEMKNRISCDFFAKYIGQILIASKVEPLRGLSWSFKGD